jgi:nitrogen fixation protein FixH
MTRPNYRFNPWPVSIIAFFSVAIVSCLGFVIFCSFNGSELVASDYYEQEIAYQHQMESLERTRALPEPPTITYDFQSQQILLKLPATQQGAKISGSITLYRPSAAALDREKPLELDSHGRQSIDASTLAPGRWTIKVNWTLNGLRYAFEQNIVTIGA